jgi:hypothetical protein
MTTEEAELAFGPIPLVTNASAKWRDGFRVSRLCTDDKRGYLWIEVEWNGAVREIRLSKAKTLVGSMRRTKPRTVNAEAPPA